MRRHHHHHDTPLANDLSQEIAAAKRRLPGGGISSLPRLVRVVAAHGMVIESLIATIAELERELAQVRREQAAGSR